MLIIFQIVNIVISRELGALAVTQFNVAEKYFNIIYMVINIIMIHFGQLLLMLIQKEI